MGASTKFDPAQALSTGQVSLVNRKASALAREAGLAATSLNIAGMAKTYGGAVALLANYGLDLAEALAVVQSAEGLTRTDLVAALAGQVPAKKGAKKAGTKKAGAKKASTKKAPAKGKATKTQVATQVKAEAPARPMNLDAAVIRLAKAPKGHWLPTWWAKKHPAEAAQIGLNADGSAKKGSALAKAKAEYAKAQKAALV